jgi:hypothetical protein
MRLVGHTPWLMPLVLISMVGLVSLLRPTEPVRDIGQASDKARDTKQQEPDAKQANGRAAAQGDQTKANIYSPDCQKPKDHPEADLCVQRRMADAAETQNHINAWTSASWTERT